MSASKSDRLGRNPFDRGTYSQAPKGASKSSKSSGSKKGTAKAKASRQPQPAWRMILNELDRHAPKAVRDLKICKRVAQLAEFASTRLSQFARHLEA
jgi:hypothetical protein